MIAGVRGRLVSKKPRCIVEVGGIGLELMVSERDLEALGAIGAEVTFHTYLYVREDKLVLFGFLRADDRDLFLRLIDVSGIGPRTAMNMISNLPASRIVAAVRKGEVAALVSVPGLGKKSAERLIMELKDKITDFEATEDERRPAETMREEVILALTALGMSRFAAEQAAGKIAWDELAEKDVETAVKEALKHATGS